MEVLSDETRLSKVGIFYESYEVDKLLQVSMAQAFSPMYARSCTCTQGQGWPDSCFLRSLSFNFPGCRCASLFLPAFA